MATTTRGYRYPTSADDVRPYEDLQFLATDVDADMANVDRGPVGVSNAAVTSGTDSTVSGTYVNMAGTGAVVSFSFTKTRAATRVRLSMAGSWSATVATTLARFGMNINSIDVDCDHGVLAAGASGKFSGWGYATGVPAGTYTVTARMRRESASGQVNRGTNDWLCLEAEEIV